MEQTEIRKHILLWMIEMKEQGKTQGEIQTSVKTLLNRLLRAVDTGAAWEAMLNAENNLNSIEEGMRRVQKYEHKRL